MERDKEYEINRKEWEEIKRMMLEIIGEEVEEEPLDVKFHRISRELQEVLVEMGKYVMYGPVEVVRYFEEQLESGRELLERLKERE